MSRRRASPRDCARALWILGLEPPVTGAELQAAYRARIARAHPDLHLNSAARTDAAGASERAEDMRAELARGLADAGTPLNVSIGVATYPFDGATGTQLVRAADQGLYLAKSSGKDLVVAFRDLGEWSRRGRRQADRRAGEHRGPALDARAGIEALAVEQTPETVLVALCRTLTAALTATASLVSRVDGERIIDGASYALRDIDLGEASSYLIDDFPLTRSVLDRREA